MTKNLPDDIAIFSSLSQPCLVCERGNKIIRANYAAESFFSMSANMLTKQKLDDIIAFGSPILSIVDNICQNLAPISEYRMNLELISKDKILEENTKIVDIFASPIIEQKDLVLILFLERSTAEKIDRQLLSRNAVRSASGLAAMLAHEIKNPLAGIRGAAQLLEQSIKSDNDIALARLIREETDRIVALLEKVDIFSDERVLDVEPVNIHIVLERVKLLSQSSQGGNIEFIEQYDPSLPPILGNKDQLIQVFLNLVKNSMEALKGVKNPQIKISTAFKPGIHISLAGVKKRMSLPFEIIVEDNGHGVPKEIMEHLFDPFVTTKPNGKGLGLALVAKIIADHGGVIDVESKRGNTKFRILLPIANQNLAQGQNKNNGS